MDATGSPYLFGSAELAGCAAFRTATFAPSVNRLKLSAATIAPGCTPCTSETLPSVLTTVIVFSATL